MTQRFHSARIIAAVVLAVPVAIACSGALRSQTTPTAPTGFHVVAAGSPELRQATEAVDQWRIYTKSDTGDTAAKQVATIRIKLQNNASNDLVTMTRAQPPSTTFADTIVMRRAGLTPVHERLVSRTNRMDIEYFGDSVYSRRYRSDTLISTKARRYRYAPFGFNQMETVLTRLPLREGYQALLPLYSEGDDSVEVDSVSVTGLVTGDPPRWRVRFADAVVIVNYMIDTATHRIAGIERGSGRVARGRWSFSVAEPQS